jgi:hypothetical protein
MHLVLYVIAARGVDSTWSGTAAQGAPRTCFGHSFNKTEQCLGQDVVTHNRSPGPQVLENIEILRRGCSGDIFYSQSGVNIPSFLYIEI